MELANKICLVTGGTRGIGAAIALDLAEAGASVALVARRNDEIAQSVRAGVERLGQRCLLMAADVGRPEAAAACVQRTIAELGGLDVLVHSAKAVR